MTDEQKPVLAQIEEDLARLDETAASTADPDELQALSQRLDRNSRTLKQQDPAAWSALLPRLADVQAKAAARLLGRDYTTPDGSDWP